MKEVRILAYDAHALTNKYWLAKRMYYEFEKPASYKRILKEFKRIITPKTLQRIVRLVDCLPNNYWVDCYGYAGVKDKDSVSYEGPYFYLINGYIDEAGKLFVNTADIQVR